jgi:hypothetical protein
MDTELIVVTVLVRTELSPALPDLQGKSPGACGCLGQARQRKCVCRGALHSDSQEPSIEVQMARESLTLKQPEVRGPEDTDIPLPPTTVGGLSGPAALPLTQGEAAAGPGPQQPLTLCMPSL